MFTWFPTTGGAVVKTQPNNLKVVGSSLSTTTSYIITIPFPRHPLIRPNWALILHDSQPRASQTTLHGDYQMYAWNLANVKQLCSVRSLNIQQAFDNHVAAHTRREFQWRTKPHSQNQIGARQCLIYALNTELMAYGYLFAPTEKNSIHCHCQLLKN